jgi:hypothetical protein
LEEVTEATRLPVLIAPVLVGVILRLREEVERVRVVSGEEGSAEALYSAGMKRL